MNYTSSYGEKNTNVDIKELVPVRRDEEVDAVDGPGQGYPSHQQDHQHTVGEQSCEPDHLRTEYICK